MKKNFLLHSLLISAFLLLASSTSMAALFNNAKTLKGTIDQIGGDLITISQSNPTVRSQSASMAKVDVSIDQNTQFKDVDSLASLRKGDEIRVQYKEGQAGQKVAVEIAKLGTSTDDFNDSSLKSENYRSTGNTGSEVNTPNYGSTSSSQPQGTRY